MIVACEKDKSIERQKKLAVCCQQPLAFWDAAVMRLFPRTCDCGGVFPLTPMEAQWTGVLS